MAIEDISQLRTMIPDAEPIFGDAEDEYLFTDDELNNFLAIGRGSVLRAAGYAKIAIGDSEALISKVIRTQDLQTNGAAVADAFRKSGQLLLERGDKEEEDAGGFYIDIVDFQSSFYGRGIPELTEWNWPT